MCGVRVVAEVLKLRGVRVAADEQKSTAQCKEGNNHTRTQARECTYCGSDIFLDPSK